MKKFIATVVTVVLAAALTACSSGGKDLSFSDVAVLDSEGNVLLEYGMKQEVADRYIGVEPVMVLGNYDEPIMWLKYDGKFTGVYRNGEDERRIAAVNISEEAGDDYKTTRGITVESTKEEIIKAYGKKYEVYDRSITYLYDLESKQFLTRSELSDLAYKEKDNKPIEEIYKNVICIDFIFEDDVDAAHNKIDDIMMSDYMWATSRS